jgi:hypothetical protein
MQAITAAKDGDALGVRYVSSPTSLGQIKGLGFPIRARSIDSETMNLASTPRPRLRSPKWISSPAALWISVFGTITLDRFSIALNLLDKYDRQPVRRTIRSSMMSWVDEIEHDVEVDHYENNVPLYHYTGTFLHQPIDLVSPGSKSDLFVEQVIKVSLTQLVRPGGSLRKNVRPDLLDADPPDVISRHAPRRPQFDGSRGC